VQRLVKEVYPDIFGPPRECLAVKHLLQAIHDKDATFYIRDKSPASLTKTCTLYERYTALTSVSRTGVRGVNDENPRIDTSALQKQVSEAIERMTAATTQQLQRLTAAMDSLKPAIAPPPAPARPSSQPRLADAAPLQPSQPPPPSVLRKPCPRCGQTGHWARDCIQPAQQPPPTGGCFHCGQPGHQSRECATSLNHRGPTPAPNVGPRLNQLHLATCTAWGSLPTCSY